MHFDFAPGRILARKYQVLSRLGARPTGELYRLSERATDIERTARFFAPHLDPENRLANRCAQKLHKLRHCDILMHYRTQETIKVQGRPVTFLVSDQVRGVPLSRFLANQPGGRLAWFQAMHLLHALATGLEKVHNAGEYHGELGIDNIAVRRHGLGFKVKLLDLSPLTGAPRHAVQNDVYDLLRVFHEAIGGARFYSDLPDEVREMCCGLRRPATFAKYHHAGELKRHLETMSWG
jgi:serine/threonine protein kinase